MAGLKIYLRRKVCVPQEVMEIGKDVAKRIRERMEAQSERSLKNGDS